MRLRGKCWKLLKIFLEKLVDKGFNRRYNTNPKGGKKNDGIVLQKVC